MFIQSPTCACTCTRVFPDLPPLAVDVSDAVGQRVGSQQRGGALRPVHRHQRVLAHQHLAHVLRARHPDQGAAQQVGLEHVAVLLPPRRVEARTLDREDTKRSIIKLNGLKEHGRLRNVLKIWVWVTILRPFLLDK